ncbi:hypothetical protein KZI27_00980 (plasmid) [Curtobacterium sp. TC1]|uniref:hypothetical protein n=1 Tax=Curtobacterium sp. TC1 TaxID=2862880 RepID=UPI001C9B2189|nr:hypothetical protein [Curtobacterium sp. TC1]QZQ53749.1 hypothetical protein KZI27_00980 [Curtobacterium sp. TC1]
MSDTDAHAAVFTEADLGGTIACDLTGWLPISFDDEADEQWGVTLIAGLRHDPALALWGVATWDRMQQPVCCFTAPVTSSEATLRAAAAAALASLGMTAHG